MSTTDTPESPKPASPKPVRRRRKVADSAATPPAPTAATAAAEATPEPSPAPLFTAVLDVRWRDLDAFNHVNNSNYLTYLEEARLQWLSHVPGPWFGDHAMPVMAATQLNYRRPIEWPAQLHVELFCERVGNTSMTITHRIVDAADASRCYCDGNVVMVWMDPTSGKPVPLPEAIRGAVG
ncbi:acyl-CoA thioesterase [Rhodanobacter glycinis]|uniref:Acyl-CoA thioester hydrolase n=1 Tax=Rhodanobacter glycinis TaxID=582702 RepID=A0A1I3XTK2_9GAMM|nr:thioesterase family protein [Rhodanobacter glycinis]SFK22842.1 acyl-CoA thioester hydrolase [Rhodanobacter glycinis]